MDVDEFYNIEDSIFWDLKWVSYSLALTVSDLLAHAYVRWYPHPFRRV